METEERGIAKIAEKWGFGMAPPKAITQKQRAESAEQFLQMLQATLLPDSTTEKLDAISTVKGLFNRVVREDQWDWFTVSRQLGYPSRGISDAIARDLSRFRTSIRDTDQTEFGLTRSSLLRLPVRRCLDVFLGRYRIMDEPGAGWVYILSNREYRDLLKIGMTSRTVEQRAGEINAATGVAIPFGVRRCWRVSDPRAAEKIVHECLATYRLRGDREFFRVDFQVAARLLSEAIKLSGLEIRTLNALTALD